MARTYTRKSQRRTASMPTTCQLWYGLDLVPADMAKDSGLEWTLEKAGAHGHPRRLPEAPSGAEIPVPDPVPNKLRRWGRRRRSQSGSAITTQARNRLAASPSSGSPKPLAESSIRRPPCFNCITHQRPKPGTSAPVEVRTAQPGVGEDRPANEASSSGPSTLPRGDWSRLVELIPRSQRQH
jgi:hypothetical protein